MNISIRNISKTIISLSIRDKFHLIAGYVKIADALQVFFTDSEKHLNDFIAIIVKTIALIQISLVRLGY
jgi:hypothetical protein